MAGATTYKFEGDFTIKRDPPTGGQASPLIYYKFVISKNHLSGSPPFSSVANKMFCAAGSKNPDDCSRTAAFEAFKVGRLNVSADGSDGNSVDLIPSDAKEGTVVGMSHYVLGATDDKKTHTWYVTGVYDWISAKGKRSKLPIIDFEVKAYPTVDMNDGDEIELPNGSVLHKEFTLWVGSGGRAYIRLKPCDPTKMEGGVDVSSTAGGSAAAKCLWGIGPGSPHSQTSWWIESSDAHFIAHLGVDMEAAVAASMVGSFNINKGCAGKKWPNDVQECYEFVEFLDTDVSGAAIPSPVFGADNTGTKDCKLWMDIKKCARLRSARADCGSCGPRGGKELARVGMTSLTHKGFGDAISVVSVNAFTTNESDDNAGEIAWTSITMQGFTNESLGEMPGDNAQSTNWDVSMKYVPKDGDDAYIYSATLDIQFDIVRSMSWELFKRYRQAIEVTGNYDWDKEEYENVIVSGTEASLQKMFLKKTYATAAHFKIQGELNNNFKVGFNMSASVPSGIDTIGEDDIWTIEMSAYMTLDDIFTHAFDEFGDRNAEAAWDSLRMDIGIGNDISGVQAKKWANQRINGKGAGGTHKDTEASILAEAKEYMDQNGILGTDKIWIEHVTLDYQLHFPNGINFSAKLKFDKGGAMLNPKIDYTYSVTDALTFSFELSKVLQSGGKANSPHHLALGINYDKQIMKMTDPLKRIWDLMPGPDSQSSGQLKIGVDTGLAWDNGNESPALGNIVSGFTVNASFSDMLEADFDVLTGEASVEFKRRLWDSNGEQAAPGEYEDPDGCQRFITNGADCGKKGLNCGENKKLWHLTPGKWQKCHDQCGNCIQGRLEAWFRSSSAAGGANWTAGLDLTIEKSLANFGPIFGRVRAFASGSLVISSGGSGNTPGIKYAGFQFTLKIVAGVEWRNNILEYLGFPFNINWSPTIGIGINFAMGARTSYNTPVANNSGTVFDCALGMSQIGIELVSGARAEIRRMHNSVFGRIPLIGSFLASLPILKTLGGKESIESYAFRVGTDRAVRLFTKCSDDWDASYVKFRKRLKNSHAVKPTCSHKAPKIYVFNNIKPFELACSTCNQKKDSDEPGDPHPRKTECMCDVLVPYFEDNFPDAVEKGDVFKDVPGYRWCKETMEWRRANPFCTSVENCFKGTTVSARYIDYNSDVFPSNCDDAAPNDRSKCFDDHMTLSYIFDIWSEREDLVFQNFIQGKKPTRGAAVFNSKYKCRGDECADKSANIFSWFWKKFKTFMESVWNFIGLFKGKKDYYCRGIEGGRCLGTNKSKDTYAKAYTDFILGGDDAKVVWDENTAASMDGFIGRRFVLGNKNSKGLYPTAGDPSAPGEYQKSIKGCLADPTGGSNQAVDPDHAAFNAQQIWRFYADPNGCHERNHRDLEKAQALMTGGHVAQVVNWEVCCCQNTQEFSLQSCKDSAGGNCCCQPSKLAQKCKDDQGTFPGCAGFEGEALDDCCDRTGQADYDNFITILKTANSGKSLLLQEEPYKTWLAGSSCNSSPNVLGSEAARVTGGHSSTWQGHACHGDDEQALNSTLKIYQVTRGQIMNNVARPELRGPLYTNSPAAEVPVKRNKDGTFDMRNIYDLTSVPGYPLQETPAANDLDGDSQYYANFGEILRDLNMLAGLGTSATAIRTTPVFKPAEFPKTYRALRRLRDKLDKTMGADQSFSGGFHVIQKKAFGYIVMASKILAVNFRQKVLAYWKKSKIYDDIMTHGKQHSNYKLRGNNPFVPVHPSTVGPNGVALLGKGAIWVHGSVDVNSNPKTGFGTKFNESLFKTPYDWLIRPLGAKVHTAISGKPELLRRTAWMHNMQVIGQVLGVRFNCDGEDEYCKGKPRLQEIDPSDPAGMPIEWHFGKWDDTWMGKTGDANYGKPISANTEMALAGVIPMMNRHNMMMGVSHFYKDGFFISQGGQIQLIDGENLFHRITEGRLQTGTTWSKTNWAWGLMDNGKIFPAPSKAGPLQEAWIKRHPPHFEKPPELISGVDYHSGSKKIGSHFDKQRGGSVYKGSWACIPNTGAFLSFGVPLDFIYYGNIDPTKSDYLALIHIYERVNSAEALYKPVTGGGLSKLNEAEASNLCCYWGNGTAGCCKNPQYHASNKWKVNKAPCWGTGAGRPAIDEDWGNTPSWHDLKVP